MGADMHIHVLTEECRMKHVRMFFNGTTDDDLGEKWKKLPRKAKRKFRKQFIENTHRLVDKTPNIWVGELSWAADEVPNPLWKIYEIIGEDNKFPIINEELIRSIENALKLPNQTTYPIASPKNLGIKKCPYLADDGERISTIQDVLDFLEKHKGKKCFTISW